MRSFGRADTLRCLGQLLDWQRAAYAAACAERLLPLYRWFQNSEAWGDVEPLESGIELVWNWIRVSGCDGSVLSAAIEACEAVTPDLENFSSSLASRALDSASAVAQALEVCVNPTCENTADAGEIAWECAFGMEQSRLGNFPIARIADREFLENAASGSLVLLEEDLQRRSLEALTHIAFTSEMITNFRREFAQLGG